MGVCGGAAWDLLSRVELCIVDKVLKLWWRADVTWQGHVLEFFYEHMGQHEQIMSVARMMGSDCEKCWSITEEYSSSSGIFGCNFFGHELWQSQRGHECLYPNQWGLQTDGKVRVYGIWRKPQKCQKDEYGGCPMKNKDPWDCLDYGTAAKSTDWLHWIWSKMDAWCRSQWHIRRLWDKMDRSKGNTNKPPFANIVGWASNPPWNEE